MIQDRPYAEELLEALAGFLEERVRDAVDPSLQFDVRVAANCCRILAREMTTSETGVMQALTVLMEERGDRTWHVRSRDDVLALQRELSRALRAGELDNHLSETAAALTPLVALKLAVTNPRYMLAATE